MEDRSSKTEVKASEVHQSQCREEHCNNGVCASPNDPSGQYCSCDEGWAGQLCSWDEAQLKKATKLVGRALDALKGMDFKGEGSREVAISSVAALTGDPDMISEESASAALDILTVGSDVELSASSATTAFSSVSNVLSAHSHHSKGASKAAHRDMANKIRMAAGSIVDSVDVTQPDK